MLIYLHVKNFALINELEIDFRKGLTVLSGETGAGKSIIIGSMNAMLAGKLDKGIIRSGSEYALIEMIFTVERDLVDYLESNYGVPFDEEHHLILSRKFSAGGRSVYRINGETATSTLVKEISEQMIDIHSQHDHQSLLKANQHITLLDHYIGEDIVSLKAALKEKYTTYKTYMKQLQTDAMDDENRRREIDFLKFEINEIESANLEVGEDVSLGQEYKILSNRQKIIQSLSDVGFLLEGNPEGSVLELLGAALDNLSSVKQYDDAIDEITTETIQAESLIRDLSRSIESYHGSLEMDHKNLDDIEDRLHVINTLKSKFGEDIDEIIVLESTKRKKLEYLENYEENLETIKAEIKIFETDILEMCARISTIRKRYAIDISREIELVLTELNFTDARVDVSVVSSDKFDASGFDQVTILISTNKNEPVQPLNKIASGGELSRVMLALKSVFARQDKIGTLVFDEIDSGISGRTAQKVAEKMASLAGTRQTICITHLPQISAMADDHYLIEKSEVDGRVETSLKLLKDQGIYEELARLIGGATITNNTLETAKEMKEQARALKR